MINKMLDSIFSNWISQFYCSTIIKVAEVDYSDTIYNLSIADDETFICDGFVVHNCRTDTAPELSEEFAKFDDGGTRSAKGPDGGEQASSQQQYYDWLKNKPASFQNDALGVERAKIFRNSGLTPAEFKKASVDRLGNPLTIKQMAQRDDRIKEYLQ